MFFYTEKTEESVYVLTKGSITVKDHTLNIEVPRTAIQLQSGDVINPGIIDGNLVKGFHLWFRCNTDVEAISMDRKVFDVNSSHKGTLVRPNVFWPRHNMHGAEKDSDLHERLTDDSFQDSLRSHEGADLYPAHDNL